MPDRHGPMRSFIDPVEGVTLDDFGTRQKDRLSDAIRGLDPQWLTSEEVGEQPPYLDSVLVSKDLGDRPGFNKIQDAIDGTDPKNGASGATEGDRILVEPGTYEERPKVTDTNGLTIRGTDLDRGNVVIDASDDEQFDNPYGFKVEADDITLKSFTLKGPVQPPESDGYPSSYFGFKIAGCEKIKIEDVAVEGSSLTQIDLNSVNGAELTNVTADGTNPNADSTGGTGIFLTNCVDVRLEGVTTRNNDWGGIGISAWSADRYPTPNPTARGIRLKGTNTIEDTPILYTEEQPKEVPYHAGERRGEKINTNEGEEETNWDVRFPVDGIERAEGEQPHDVTGATIETGELSGSLSHTVVYDRADPPQVAETYHLSQERAESAQADLGEGYEILLEAGELGGERTAEPPQ